MHDFEISKWLRPAEKVRRKHSFGNQSKRAATTVVEFSLYEKNQGPTWKLFTFGTKREFFVYSENWMTSSFSEDVIEDNPRI